VYYALARVYLVTCVWHTIWFGSPKKKILLPYTICFGSPKKEYTPNIKLLIWLSKKRRYHSMFMKPMLYILCIFLRLSIKFRSKLFHHSENSLPCNFIQCTCHHTVCLHYVQYCCSFIQIVAHFAHINKTLVVQSRGSSRDGTGVHDSIVNQLLTKVCSRNLKYFMFFAHMYY
jgi:hypothetical protein